MTTDVDLPSAVSRQFPSARPRASLDCPAFDLPATDVVAALNAAYLDWSFREDVVLAELTQLQYNWGISFHGEDRIVIGANERGRTLLIVDSTKMTPFLISQAQRLAEACDTELRRFTLGDGVTTDN